MNVAAKALQGNKLAFDPSLDVNETAAIVLAAKRGLIRDSNAHSGEDAHLASASGRGARLKGESKTRKPSKGRSAILFWVEVRRRTLPCRLSRKFRKCSVSMSAGHDYFLQVTDARPDTGGLSGATPGEAVSWGKVDPDRLPDAGRMLFGFDGGAAYSYRVCAGETQTTATTTLVRAP
jgi:deoxyhypusine synthase